MIAMRYGCIPVARATGGLVDTIQDNEETASNTGFLFYQASVEGLASAFTRAINTFSNPENWTLLQRNAMNQDFSWSRSAASYYHLYKNLEQGSPK
jgi:starch synthase